MNFTFGIISGSSNIALGEYLPKIIKSIRELNIPKYEILLVGDYDYLKQFKHKDLNIISFDEKAKNKWITRKKNLITKNAKYDNIVFQHDYIYYDPNWYQGFLNFGDDFQICVNKIKNIHGQRFRDWVIFPYHHARDNLKSNLARELWKYSQIENNESMIPYNENRLTRFQYISGAYWVAKKHIMEEIPLDENLTWGQEEDVTWSIKILEKYKLTMNKNSTVHLIKEKQDAFGIIKPDCLQKCIEFAND